MHWERRVLALVHHERVLILTSFGPRLNLSTLHFMRLSSEMQVSPLTLQIFLLFLASKFSTIHYHVAKQIAGEKLLHISTGVQRPRSLMTEWWGYGRGGEAQRERISFNL